MALIVICGVAASGKTSLALALARAEGWLCLDADAYHPPANLAKMRAGSPLDEADREPWLAALEDAVRALGRRDAVLAFPGLKAVHRERIRRAAGSARFLWLEISEATAMARLRARGGFFPPSLAATQFAALELDPALPSLDAEQSLERLLDQARHWAREQAI